MYVPPYTISETSLAHVAEITRLLEKHKNLLHVRESLRLRRQNTVRSVCSSLATEGIAMTEHQVDHIMSGRDVLAPAREVQAVKNALDAYALFSKLNPFSVEDLLRAHGVMMRGLCDFPGQFRRSGVDVFSGTEAVHMAPPADRVSGLVQDLFSWLSRTDAHWLIRSCVFHYEFEFIHPFADGNGRLGRFWQSLLLAAAHPVFAYIPVENLVHRSQSAYYAAISSSTELADCSPFIEFMLTAIHDALVSHIRTRRPIPSSSPRQRRVQVESRILSLLRSTPALTVAQLAQKLHVSERTIARRLASLRERGLLPPSQRVR